MYIEKLTNQDIKQIFFKLVSIAENGNLDTVKECNKTAKLQKNKDVFYIKFKSNGEEFYCCIKDYYASLTYGYVRDDKKVLTEYKRFMYKKFGDAYYNDLKDFHLHEIFKKCDKEMKLLSDDLKEVIK